MTEEVENYYKEVYNIELTDDQVAQMYTPSADDGKWIWKQQIKKENGIQGAVFILICLRLCN